MDDKEKGLPECCTKTKVVVEDVDCSLPAQKTQALLGDRPAVDFWKTAKGLGFLRAGDARRLRRLFSSHL